MLRLLATIFAALAGLAFGSFLNVCLSRWPAGESIVKPRSHCLACNRTLTWWENIPLVSWLVLRGRCRTCKSWIGWRYPLVELAVATPWVCSTWNNLPLLVSFNPSAAIVTIFGQWIFLWLLVALAFLDAEHLWLPNWLTVPGTILGFLAVLLEAYLRAPLTLTFYGATQLQNRILLYIAWHRLAAIAIAAGLILFIRWLYWLIRRREGIGLGDAKLMALLAAWLGLPGALLSFCFGVTLGAAVALVILARLSQKGHRPALAKLPLGTFLCTGGIVSSLWGQQILAAYLRWSGLN